MKKLLTITALLFSLTSFGQSTDCQCQCKKEKYGALSGKIYYSRGSWHSYEQIDKPKTEKHPIKPKKKDKPLRTSGFSYGTYASKDNPATRTDVKVLYYRDSSVSYINGKKANVIHNDSTMKKKSRLNKVVEKKQNNGFSYGMKIFGNPVHDSYRSLLQETFLIGVKGISFYENSNEVTLDWETLKKPRPTKGEANLLKQNRNVFIGTKPLYSNNGIVIATGYAPLQNFPVNYLPKYLSNGSSNTVISNKNNQ